MKDVISVDSKRHGMSKTPNKIRIAQMLGVSRVTLDSYIKNPDKMQLGNYKKLQALGLEGILGKDNSSYEICSRCGGTGIAKIFTEVADDDVAQDGSANTEPLRELAHSSNSKSEDTLLYETEDAELQGLIDWIIFEPAYTPVDMKEKILVWHKAEIAKFFEQIRSDLDKSYKNAGKGSRNQFSKDTETRGEHYSRTQGFKSGILVAREALTRLEGIDGQTT